MSDSNPDPNSNPIGEVDLKQMYEESGCDDTTNNFSKECNKFLLRKEFLERTELAEHPEEDSYLYPTLNDPNFTVKIAEKKEFNDTQYDGKIYDIKEHAEVLANADFELAPHQSFVRNFLSSQTPYNSLLLFHGLGSGKTCSAIGVAEEQRDYLKALGISKRIIIVASPNVQDNFRLQLFDERKLQQGPGGIWTTSGCVSNKLLKEVNPMNMKGMTREKIISQVKTLINNSYLFLGYNEFANYIAKTENLEAYRQKRGARTDTGTTMDARKMRSLERNLKNEFNDRLIIIDEIHNIRETEESDNKVVASQLLNLVKKANNLRLLLLSATPVYNSYKEIVWLLNLLNANDRRATIEVRDIFDANGNFKKNAQGEEIGKELLVRKATGYISFVRGDNPYTFPFRVYPSIFSPDNTFKVLPYPTYQMNGKEIVKDDQFITYLEMAQTYALEIGSYQSLGYRYVLDVLKNREMAVTTKQGIIRQMPSFENMDSFGYHLLRVPLESLIIVYPIPNLESAVSQVPPKLGEEPEIKTAVVATPTVEPGIKKEDHEAVPVEAQKEGVSDAESDVESESDFESGDEKERDYINASDLTGKRGLKRVMTFTDTISPPIMGDFEYKPAILQQYGRIFSPNEIGKYSSKIKTICDNALHSEGITLIYSEYIPGGVIPTALALEEMGFRRYGNKSKNLFKTPPSEPVDVITKLPRQSPTDKSFVPARYILITGNPRLSPDNDADIKAATSTDNKNGH